ncbi:MAG: hypothetical protein ACYCS8_00580 [Acidithiobacillus sp.]
MTEILKITQSLSNVIAHIFQLFPIPFFFQGVYHVLQNETDPFGVGDKSVLKTFTL